MILQFTERERNYIVNSEETNLLLTEVGMRLVDKIGAHDGLMCIEASTAEVDEFVSELRATLQEKRDGITEPGTLKGLARRLLPDYRK